MGRHERGFLSNFLTLRNYEPPLPPSQSCLRAPSATIFQALASGRVPGTSILLLTLCFRVILIFIRSLSSTMMEVQPPPNRTSRLSASAEEYNGIDNDNDYDNNDLNGHEQEQELLQAIPSEAELVLLCLDYLRDLRRAYPSPQDLEQAEGLNADYLTTAIYSLSRAFVAPCPVELQHVSGNDAAFLEKTLVPGEEMASPTATSSPTATGAGTVTGTVTGAGAGTVDCNPLLFPSLEQMEEEFLYSTNPNSNQNHNQNPLLEDGEHKQPDDPQQEPLDYNSPSHHWYDYNDAHASNAHRFYLLNGLASGPSLRSHLGLADIATAGLLHLQARARAQAEHDMIQSPLFDQFVQAVESKGFFKDADNQVPFDNDPYLENERLEKQQAVYQERFGKVVTKFRTKLASKAQTESLSSTSSSPVLPSFGALQVQRRLLRVQQAQDEGHSSPHVRPPVVHVSVAPRSMSVRATVPAPSTTPTLHPVDLEEAERSKSLGNTHMQKKEYELAAQAYTKALQLSPSGPNSHVYFSNRAAALLSMKKFREAILDSERSLKLKPNYGKAHARLGLAHFLLGDYRQAMEAYSVALKYEPDNNSSKSYLEKAAKRLAQEETETMNTNANTSHAPPPITTSFSVVSEWDKSTRQENATSTEQAEKYKTKGNACMANKEYQAAFEAYTNAIQAAPNGSQSHVYYSNRAAALCYLERYHEAEQDSEFSLQLKPTYGKAHARLGLSRFFRNNYSGAIEAYTAALEYDPDNAASKSYLIKAKTKLEKQQQQLQLKNKQSDKNVRDLLHDPDMQLLAKKAMQVHSPSSLLNDPEMQSIAKKAMGDPTMMQAVMAMQHSK
jgi:tetratricopeptide (TPR) repeat protein